MASSSKKRTLRRVSRFIISGRRASLEGTVACSIIPPPEKPALFPQLATETAIHAVGSTDCVSFVRRLELATAGEVALVVAEIRSIE